MPRSRKFIKLYLYGQRIGCKKSRSMKNDIIQLSQVEFSGFFFFLCGQKEENK